jgi:ectoine hydroxylase-related dioxygenase (phytanoyl-CoA dioxygenase family)
MRITDDHLRQWREHGYTVVEHFIEPDRLRAIQAYLLATYPSFEQYASAPEVYKTNAHGGYMRELPFLGDTLNFVAVDPEIIAFAERALGTERIALTQSIVWAKYPIVDNYEQALHLDYTNTSLTFPNDDEGYPEEVTFLIYYVDVDPYIGPTYVVSRQNTRDNPMVPYRQPRSEFPALYAYEQPVHVPAGSMLIYSNSTFHRASAILAPDRVRLSHHLMIRTEDAPWIGYCHWGTQGLSPEMIDFVQKASPRQREMIGFPRVGHSYWNAKTLEGIAGRYPAMDMAPYIEHAPLTEEVKERVRQRIAEARRRDARPVRAQPAQSPLQLQDAYNRGIADYYSAVSGLPADLWLAWLSSR